MFLKSIAACEFRNLKGEINWEHGLNILFGNNGQGKTNWLEAIYLLAHARSFRTSRLNEVIRFGGDRAAVNGTVTRGNGVERHLQVSIHGNTKRTEVNDKREPISRYAAQLHAVCFTADELQVVRGGPEARRNFLDRGSISLHPVFAQTLSDYNKVIAQKRRILQQAADDQSVRTGLAEIIEP